MWRFIFIFYIWPNTVHSSIMYELYTRSCEGLFLYFTSGQILCTVASCMMLYLYLYFYLSFSFSFYLYLYLYLHLYLYFYFYLGPEQVQKLSQGFLSISLSLSLCLSLEYLRCGKRTFGQGVGRNVLLTYLISILYVSGSSRAFLSLWAFLSLLPQVSQVKWTVTLCMEDSR